MNIRHNPISANGPSVQHKQKIAPSKPANQDFAAILSGYGKTKGSQAPQGTANPATKTKTKAKTLQDYRLEAAPSRYRTQRQKSAVAAKAPVSATATQVPEKLQRVIEESARKYELPEKLLTAVIKVESNFNPRAVSSEGAKGLMQLMPATARKLGVKNAFDIAQNIDGGSRYLKQMLERYGGRVDLALAAYNAGPGAVDRHRGIPPYKETKGYVKKVMAYC